MTAPSPSGSCSRSRGSSRRRRTSATRRKSGRRAEARSTSTSISIAGSAAPRSRKPLDEVTESANRLFFYAAASSGCNRPWIALNELFGANLPTPWSATNTVYRANVLAFIKILAGHGAHVFLLVNSKPYTADEAGEWWREVAKYSDFVREVYFPAPLISKQGPILGNRTMRNAFRDGILELTSAGIPVTKVGLFLGFQTERGNGGREGLERLAWFRTTKWQALAAKQVAAELHVPTLWSWGWGEWGGQSVDPDKPAAACVYLWARNHSLCDGPKVAGPGFNTSMTEGQINLPSGVQCVVGGTRLTESSIRRLVSVTKDRQVAYSALFARTVEGSYADVSTAGVLALERAVVAAHFHGSSSAYRAALAKEGANVAVARGILGDELRQAAIESRIKVSQPSSSAIASFYDEFGEPARPPGGSREGSLVAGGAEEGGAGHLLRRPRPGVPGEGRPLDDRRQRLGPVEGQAARPGGAARRLLSCQGAAVDRSGAASELANERLPELDGGQAALCAEADGLPA